MASAAGVRAVACSTSAVTQPHSEAQTSIFTTAYRDDATPPTNGFAERAEQVRIVHNGTCTEDSNHRPVKLMKR